MRAKWIALAASMLMVSGPARADLADIHKEKLPQDSAVQKAYADAVSMEDLVRQWSDKWRYETPKSEVASRLKASLGELQKALALAPTNEELVLLTGLVAHYAYNVDVEGSYELAVDSLEKAHKLAPNDYRADWFLGVHQCNANLVKEGMERLLDVEKRLAWEHLPASFWSNYAFCAYVANMPAHLLRADDHLTKLKVPPLRDRDFLLEATRKRYRTPDPTATYSAEEIWQVEQVGGRRVYTNFMFGLAFSSPGDWNPSLLEVKNGQCVVLIKTGPYAGRSGEVIPSILVLARQARPGESLQDFVKTLAPGPSATPMVAPACPAQPCSAYEIVKRGFYGQEGDGHALMTAIEREAPEFPGLLLEEPLALPATKGGNVTYFRPTGRLDRLQGTLYYMVMLDTADSVLGKAEIDYETFLKGLQTE